MSRPHARDRSARLCSERRRLFAAVREARPGQVYARASRTFYSAHIGAECVHAVTIQHAWRGLRFRGWHARACPRAGGAQVGAMVGATGYLLCTVRSGSVVYKLMRLSIGSGRQRWRL